MRILITGINGFVGGHLAAGLAPLEHQISGLARRSDPESGRNDFEMYFCDLADIAALTSVIRSAAPDVVVHAAACANSTVCQREPDKARNDNVLAVSNLCSVISARCPAPELIHISTDLVFDGYDFAPAAGFDEQDQPKTRTVYGRTKLDAEQIVARCSFPSLILRTALVYGPPSGPASGMLGWLLGSLKAGTPLTLFTDEWRNPVYIGDIVATVEAAISSGYMKRQAAADRPCRLLHLAGPERIDRYSFGLAAAKHAGLCADPIEAATRQDFLNKNRNLPPRPADISLAIGLLRRELGIATLPPEEGLNRTSSIMRGG